MKKPMWALARLGIPTPTYLVSVSPMEWCDTETKAMLFDSKYQARQARAKYGLNPEEVMPQCVT